MYGPQNTVAYLPTAVPGAPNQRQHNPAMYVYHGADPARLPQIVACPAEAPIRPNYVAWDMTQGIGQPRQSRGGGGQLAEYRPYEDGIHARPRSPDEDEDGSTPGLIFICGFFLTPMVWLAGFWWWHHPNPRARFWARVNIFAFILVLIAIAVGFFVYNLS